MEDREKNWRAEVGDNLHRLHSLLFGAEAAAERGDQATAQVLGLRLLGFLDSLTISPLDLAYITPIRAQVQSIVAAAFRALAPDSNRQAFEQARRDVGHIFVKSGDIDIQNIIISKRFQNFIQMPKGITEDQMIYKTSSDIDLDCDTLAQQKLPEIESDRQHEKLSTRTSKLMTQMKITSIYGSNSMNLNERQDKKQLNSEGCISMECIDVENEHSESYNYVKNADDTGQQTEEDEKSHAISLKIKRKHPQFTSPICGNVKSPPACEEANVDATGNGFVTARAKLEMDAKQKHGGRASLNPMSPQRENNSTGFARNYLIRSGGFPRRGFRGNFVPPIKSNGGNTGNTITSRISGKNDDLLDDSTRKWYVLTGFATQSKSILASHVKYLKVWKCCVVRMGSFQRS